MTFILPVIIFAQFMVPYENRVYLDAGGDFVIYARYFQGTLVSVDTVKTVSEYLQSNIYARNQLFLLKELKQDMVKAGGRTSKGLFGTFEIPLPKGGFSDFMGETGKLDVGGHVKITLGGSETFVANTPGVAGPSLWPELEMNQEMVINLDGQVGDRIRVFIDHNSERINESQNKITVTYRGREDEILQEIEGGDTELNIPATTYTGDIPSHRGLFGIKSSAKFGPLDIVAIASNEQTQHQEIDIEGSVQAQADSIWSREYQKRRFFWLGTHDLIDQQSLQIYVDDDNFQNNLTGVTYYGKAYVDTDTNDVIPDDTTQYEEGYFTLKNLYDDYEFRPGENIIELKYGLQKDVEKLGVRYRVVDAVGNTIRTVGALVETTLVLKLICPKSPDTLSPTWNLELKNYYQVVSPGSRLDSLRIFYITPGGQHKDRNAAGSQYLEVLGLDQNGDGRVDDIYSFGAYGFDAGRGLLIFPDPLPFVSDDLDDQDFEIYRNPYYMQGRGKYYLYKKTIETRPTFDLPPNVVDVKVYVDGVEQAEGIDYYVNFDEGRLEFKKVLPPTAQVKIQAEYAPFFSAAQKSLVGLRATLRPFGDVSLGSSFFYRTESYPTDRVRLREEPFNRMVWEGDFAVPQSLPFLTKMVDWLPLVESEAESNVNVNFEGAFSFSDLNSEGEAFLDDLESGTIVTNMIPILWTDWVLSSKPVVVDTIDFAAQRLIWYNPRGNDRLQAQDIYVDPLDPNEIADVLKVVYAPNDVSDFAGLMQYMYSENFEDCENLELVVKGTGGRIHIDLAQEMREDQLRRNKDGELVGFNTLQDEDVDRNGTWNENIEDTGLDGVFGVDAENVPDDDGNDDFDDYDYTGGINGTERNRLWNTEDIDRNGILNNNDIYYSFSIHLDDTVYMDTSGLQPGWKMFRIPIKDSLIRDTVFGYPDWRKIKYVRIWFEDFAQAETLFIYRLYAAGSRWKNLGIKGDLSTIDPTEIFTVTPVNTKTHSHYVSPYPLERDPLTGQLRSEGALELHLENIKEGHRCITRRNTDDNEDYRAYDTLTFYLNARQSNPLVSFRIGSDSLNYYEYRTEFNNGVSVAGGSGWRLFSVAFQRFLDLKHETQGQGSISDSVYSVMGNPSLSINQFLELTIVNQNSMPITDTIWFNDIKLITPQTEVGRIIRANSQINFADLASVSLSFDESNGRFKRLSESKALSTSSAGRNYAISTNIALHKFLLGRWGFNIPLGVSYRNSEQKPRFAYFANDLELAGDDLDSQKSKSIINSYTISVSKSGSRNWFLKNTLDKLTFNHTRSATSSEAVLNADTSRVTTYRATYGLDPKVAFKLLGQSFSVLPQNISFNALYTDNYARSYYRVSADSQFLYSPTGSQNRQTLNPGFSVKYSPHQILTANYDFSQTRDSVNTRGRLGEEVGRNQSLTATLAKDLKIISPRLTFASSYTEDYRFEIRREEDLRNVSNTARYGVDVRMDLKRIVGFFTRLRDETKDSLVGVGSPAWLAKQLEQFVMKIQNPSFTFTRQRSSNYLNVKVRPELRYQFGFQDSIPSTDITPGSYPGRGSNDTYNVTSGIDFKFFSLQGGYNANINRSFVLGNVETRIEGISYPNANLRILRLEALPFLKNLTHSSSITAMFTRSIERRYQVGDSLVLQSDSKNTSFTPLVSWQTNWIKGISSTVDLTYSETVTNDYQGLRPLISRSLSRGGSVSLGYTFSAPRGLGLPLLKGVKFSSSLSTNLGISYNRNTNYSGYGADLNTPIYDSSVLQADLGMSYNFSSSITGGANFSYSQNKESVRNQDTKRVSVNIWTNINF
ncbi:hypothetical protein AMJ83_00190 [candidate division WOR_3 bacterium SM23_42]|uniref:Gliding motility protein SprA N-terminal domain-containing protein n=1 Tax=candidate division WOR_3 bacterium SM23_42 TaxID=1703779 RepID=A0A0S8FVH0_UNCW3|nr:MAG: hypothetical protein AMJ83_00190 [candidate division WOR_3 bacterium SM23_42]